MKTCVLSAARTCTPRLFTFAESCYGLIFRGAECLQLIMTGYTSNPSPLGKLDYPSGNPHFKHLTGSYWFQPVSLVLEWITQFGLF